MDSVKYNSGGIVPRHIRWIRTHQSCDVIIRGDNREEFWPSDVEGIPSSLTQWKPRKVER